MATLCMKNIEQTQKIQEITNVKAVYPRISKTGLKYLSGGY